MDLLISTSDLAERLAPANQGETKLVVLDCSVFLQARVDGYDFTSGIDNWTDGHIPGSGFADLVSDLSDTTSELNFAIPAPEAFAAAMGRLGVGDETEVVLYDASGSAWAARVWWMLRWIGFDNAAVLDGGLEAWRAEGRAISTVEFVPVVRSLSCRHRPELIADRAEVLEAIGDDTVCVIDALNPEAYTEGHIPGAINAPARNMIDAETGRFLDLADLEKMVPEKHNGRTITYCGGGVAASADALVLSLLGRTDVAVYTASMQEWSTTEDSPLTAGDAP